MPSPQPHEGSFLDWQSRPSDGIILPKTIVVSDSSEEAKMTLTQEKCVACRRDSPRVTDAEIAELHPQVADWELTDTDGIKRLERKFKFSDFAAALVFSTRVGEEAESEGHHPRITLEWGRVGVEWWTHKIKGLHRNDFIMASKTDRLFAQSSGAP